MKSVTRSAGESLALAGLTDEVTSNCYESSIRITEGSGLSFQLPSNTSQAPSHVFEDAVLERQTTTVF